MPTRLILEIKMSFGDNLKRLRRDKGWTQNQLAEHSGLKTAHIPKLENDSADPKLSTIYKLVSAFGCSADTLLMDSEKIGLDGLMKANLERIESLPEINKRILIDLIDKYCIAVGMEQTFSDENKSLFKFRVYDEAPRSMLSEDEKKKI